MKSLFTAATLLALAAPAQAGYIPELAATRYCQNMRVGMPWKEAMAEAYNYSKTPAFYGGSLSDQLRGAIDEYVESTKNADYDIKRFLLGVQRHCPQYLR